MKARSWLWGVPGACLVVGSALVFLARLAGGQLLPWWTQVLVLVVTILQALLLLGAHVYCRMLRQHYEELLLGKGADR